MKYKSTWFYRLRTLAVFFLLSVKLYGYAPTNSSTPYDRLWMLPLWVDKNTERVSPLKIELQLEGGSTHSSFNDDNHPSSLLALYSPTQSALASLMGSNNNAITSVLNTVAQASDDGVRGNFLLSGVYKELDYTLATQYSHCFESIPGRFNLSLFIPLRSMEIGNVVFHDLTQNLTSDDIDVKNNVTNDISSLVFQLGNLNIASWKKNGIGDVSLLLQWLNDFPQVKRNIINVRVNGRIGVVAPTGCNRDENRALSLPLGNDGSWAAPIAAGLDLTFKKTIKGGLDVEYLKIFNNTRVRRLKTDVHQTDFLLLTSGRARKEYGTTWKFSLYAGSHCFFRGLSAYINYQYYLHNEDHLFAHSNDFNSVIINSAESLQEYNYHNLIFQASYNFSKDISSSFFQPQIMAFYKIPIAGKRVFKMNTFGLECAFNF